MNEIKNIGDWVINIGFSITNPNSIGYITKMHNKIYYVYHPTLKRTILSYDYECKKLTNMEILLYARNF